MGYRDGIADPWGTRTPFGPGDEWPVRVNQYLVEGVAADEVERWVRTASLLHSNGDAMDIAVRDGDVELAQDLDEHGVGTDRSCADREAVAEYFVGHGLLLLRPAEPNCPDDLDKLTSRSSSWKVVYHCRLDRW